MNPSGGESDGSNELRFEEFVDPVDGVRWRVDMEFVSSNWTCIWGAGCEGMLDHLAAEAGQGCCSEGAELIGEDEARRVGAIGLTLDPARFQFHQAAAEGGVYADEKRRATRVVEGACIFLNRPGFSGGAGCALHLAAIDDDEPPIDWKPSVCWQVPLKVQVADDGSGVRTLRRWGRDDWGPGGKNMAWCCTERTHSEPATASAYVGDSVVAESLFAEIQGVVGPEVAVAIRSRVQNP